MLRILDTESEIDKKVLRQKRDVYSDDEIGIRRTDFQSGGDSRQWPEAWLPVRQGVAAYHLDLVCSSLQQVDHMGEERTAVPVEQGFVPAHSSAGAASKYETVYQCGHGFDIKLVHLLRWIVVFLLENIVFRKGPTRSTMKMITLRPIVLLVL